MPTMFLSYRRSDSQDVTGRIYDRLVARFTQQQVFKDVDSIPLGVPFPIHIRQMLRKTSMVLVIIGPTWLNARDQQGLRRLDDANDFVRLEVEIALSGGVPVIPVLVSHAAMPPASDLPASMQKLVSRNGIAVRPDPDFNNDITRLIAGIDHLEKLLDAQPTKQGKNPSKGDSDGQRTESPVAKAEKKLPPPLPGPMREDRIAQAPPAGNRGGRMIRLILGAVVALTVVAVCLGLSYWVRSFKPDLNKDQAGKIGDVGPNSLGMKFVLVPRGRFWMGGGGGKPGNQLVEINADFQLGVTEVTQGQWKVIMGDNPSGFSRDKEYKERVKDINDEELLHFPVENVSWNMIQDFITRLNAREKESGWVYRLPTEAEWEHACRGGASSKEECSFHFYFQQPTNDLSSDQANFDGNHPFGNGKKGKYLERTTRVGSFQPNRLGLYDMHGNVWEWCEDPYDGGPSRVIRSGGWSYGGPDCQASNRFGFEPTYRSGNLGFRLARVPVK